MIPKHIIEKAIEGGWRPFPDEKMHKKFAIDSSGGYAVFNSQVNVRRYVFSDMVMNPLFWQSLGKAFKWPKFRCECGKWYDCSGMIFCPDCDKQGSLYSWQATAMQFYLELLTGGETEKFWSDLLANK